MKELNITSNLLFIVTSLFANQITKYVKNLYQAQHCDLERLRNNLLDRSYNERLINEAIEKTY